MDTRNRILQLARLTKGVSIPDAMLILDMGRGGILSSLDVFLMVSWGVIVQHPVFRALEEHLPEGHLSLETISKLAGIEEPKILDWVSVSWVLNDTSGVEPKYTSFAVDGVHYIERVRQCGERANQCKEK